ncbi:MAG: glycosyltransferase family 87 protein [Gemmataceae bacterium]
MASLLTMFLAYGIITVIRSAFQNERKTDFSVYAVAGYAVRVGLDPYAITDEHGWHYCYPPPFAVAMVPFADPPAGEPHAGYLPFAVSASLWYLISVLAIGVASHALASAVFPSESRADPNWWLTRLAPVWICLGGIGMTLGRGQVNLVVVCLIALGIAASIRQNSFRAGIWLGLAACIKVIPAMLFLVPLLRRDGRMILGGAVCAVVMLGIIPSAVWGVSGGIEMNRKMLEQILGPGVMGGEKDARSDELTNAVATDNQSFQYVVHNWRHPVETNRPKDYEAVSKIAHVVLSLLMLGVTAYGIGRAESTPSTQVIAFGCLAAMLPLVSPVSHMHYYAFLFPLVAGLWLKGVSETSIWPDRATMFVLIGWSLIILTSFLPIPFWKGLRPFGSCTAATLLLWAFGIGRLSFTSAKTKNAGLSPAFAKSLSASSERVI